MPRRTGTVIVVGASSGIGAALARRLALEGRKVAMLARRETELRAVATALDLPVRGGSVTVEGDLDFRGTLGVDREAPVGFARIRVAIDLEGETSPEQREKLLSLTERYCVVLQTLRRGAEVVLA